MSSLSDYVRSGLGRGKDFKDTAKNVQKKKNMPTPVHFRGGDMLDASEISPISIPK